MTAVSAKRCLSLSRALVASAALLMLARPPLGAAPQLLPGLYGYGADRATNPAGFGATSTVIQVTNLNDSGPGSLRAAIDATGSRVVVFCTSGVITLQSDLTIANGNITIAGQTAPSPGISVHGATLAVRASNVLIQHIRVRPGDAWSGPPTGSRDATKVSNQSSPPKNIVYDHCTFQWSTDEIASAPYSWDNITYHNCIFAEPLHNSIHLDENTFPVSNVPPQAESLTATKSSAFSTATTSSSAAVDGTYQVVNTGAAGDYIEYTVNIVSRSSSRPNTHLVVVGVQGPNRARYKAEIRQSNGTLIKAINEVVDQYAPSAAQQTYVTEQMTRTGFTIPASITQLKVRLIVDSKNAASTGYTLGIDQLSLSEGHGFGPLFSSGLGSNPAFEGKMSMLGCILAHCKDRGPWASAHRFYFANNINYDRGQLGLHFGTTSYPDPYVATVLGNTFIDGSWTSISAGQPSPIANSSSPSGSRLYVGAATDNAYNFGDRSSPPPLVASELTPFLISADETDKTDGLAGVVPLTPAQAFQSTLNSAGARPVDRDAQEQRIIDEISQGAATTALAARPGTIRHSVAHAGGWPVYAVNTVTLTLPANPNADDSSAGYPAGNGYTNIEEWLHERAAEVEGIIDPPVTHLDDFDDGNANGWISDGGSWTVTGSSPFVYQQTDTAAGANRSILSGTTWTDQVIEADANAVSFAPPAGSSSFFGVVARYVDANNYYYFILRSNGAIELKALVNGTVASIASGTFTVNTGAWHTLSLEVIGSNLKAYIDGMLQLQGTNTALTYGRSGLLTYHANAQFDNVLADPNPGVLTAPDSLQATVAPSPNDISQIDLAWTNVANETSYKIERKKGTGGTYTQIATTGADVTSYSDTTCGAGATYSYRVRASNGSGDSAYSTEASATTAEVTSGRQAHWKFDENTGTTAADVSGNANTGTLMNGPSWTTGKVGSALNFDAVDDVVAAGSGASLDDLPALTITAWIRANSIGEAANPGRIVHKGTGTSPTAGWQLVTQATNAIGFSVDYATTNLNHVSANNAITLGAWHHVAVSWTGSSTASTVKLYVDGVETAYGATTDGAGSRVSDATSSVFIGNDNAGLRTFDGALDDVRIYSRVLTTAELQAIYRAGL